MTVDVVRFGYQHPRVPSRSSNDARERMLASWRAEVLADPAHRDHAVLVGLAERITNRRHEVALYGTLRRDGTARADGSLSMLGERLLAELEGAQRPVRTPLRRRTLAPV